MKNEKLSGHAAVLGAALMVVTGAAFAQGHVHSSAKTTATAQVSSPLRPVALYPQRGSMIGEVFESYMSPLQEAGEEQDTPANAPQEFRSTAPSKNRVQRDLEGHRGHGVLRFRNDMSRAYVDVKIEGIRAEDVNLFHIHCGKPDNLGPVLIDFGQITDLQKSFKKGVLSVEITDQVVARSAQGDSTVEGQALAGCLVAAPSLTGGKPAKAATVSGVAQLAREGALYFNLHTYAQTYFGDLRGQLLPASPETARAARAQQNAAPKQKAASKR
ncbi:CHRD domain-containing protein [Noviherbaspirillum sp.]|uniref:CHRD domain-containing protein n=1 Tax=Noviherbaspirillum sp. TaxID=1926288 RepID=UPI002D5C75FF|nr:CHRD domain-containing protein [Noviherbaspirillum sp.]HZW22320.1 CHRD domain-containing protein [Noviherbaspirillum sp.]